MQTAYKTYETDILIIGGGTAGCFCALTLAENSDLNVIVAEKANIKRSGCLAAGVNALNAYITKNETVESYVKYVKKDFEFIVRDDLVLSIAKKLNKVTKKIEELGLPILKDKEGNYEERGKRSIKINGENIKPILAEAVLNKKNITVLNRLNIVDYIVKDDEVIGAFGFSIDSGEFFIIYAKATVCATGGASGLYKPNNPEFSRHKMWYSPFNTGAGYAMGIRAGAEMTSFEMRFIALRCKDTIAPTGTVAQGVNAPQINKKGEEYLKKYPDKSTSVRLFATIEENRKGNGPCFLKTEGISKQHEEELFKAYLNMAPSHTLKWLENNTGPSLENIEIEGTEPYITGGHSASGYWVDINRKTTLEGLYAIGDVAGGSPKKYVTGCFAEAEIAAKNILENIKSYQIKKLSKEETKDKINFIARFLYNHNSLVSIDSVESLMQELMDKYAGGISQNYIYNAENLVIAEKNINELLEISGKLKTYDFHELMLIHEIIDRLYICKVLIKHLLAREETRLKCYQDNQDFPEKDDANWLKFVNSVYKNGETKIILRNLATEEGIL